MARSYSCVDRTELLLRSDRSPLDRVGVGHVGRQREGADAAGLEVSPRRLEPLLPAREHGDVVAAVGEGARGGPADARRAPGDDRDRH